MIPCGVLLILPALFAAAACSNADGSAVVSHKPNSEAGKHADEEHVTVIQRTIGPGAVKSFNYDLPPGELWMEETASNDWMYSSWKPQYTLEVRWYCPQEILEEGLARKDSIKQFDRCVTIAQLIYFDQVKDVLIDTYEIKRIDTYDLRDVDTHNYIVPETLSEKYIEVSLVMPGQCVLVKYTLDEHSSVSTHSEKIECETVGFRASGPDSRHKWKWNVDPDDLEAEWKQKEEQEKKRKQEKQEKGKKKGVQMKSK